MVSHKFKIHSLLVSSFLLQLIPAPVAALADNNDLHYRTFQVSPDSVDGVIDPAQTASPHFLLKGGISNSASDARATTHPTEEPTSAELSEQFNNAWKALLASSFQSPECKKLEQAVDTFGNKRMYMRARTSDALNVMFMFQGVSPSSEAGDVILDEKVKLDSVGAAKYARQQQIDQIEMRVMQNLMQIAMTMGMKDSQETAQQAAEARKELVKLAGQQAADRAIASLKVVCSKHPVDNQDVASWSIANTQSRIEKTIQAAALRDPIVEEIKADVHKYNQHTTVTNAAHRLVRVTLNVASLTPNFVGPASQAVLFGYVMLSGGSEQSKIMKELYMGKRLQSRANLLNQEAELAIHQYQLGSATNNLALVACSELMVSHLVGPDAAQKVLHSTTTPSVRFASAGSIE